MPQIRKHPDWGKRYLWKNFLWSIPFLIGFAVMWLTFDDRGPNPFFVPLWILLILYAVIGACAQLRREWRCTCPECGKQIIGCKGGYDLGPGDPIRFHCEKCDIQWDTGARIGE